MMGFSFKLYGKITKGVYMKVNKKEGNFGRKR